MYRRLMLANKIIALKVQFITTTTAMNCTVTRRDHDLMETVIAAIALIAAWSRSIAAQSTKQHLRDCGGVYEAHRIYKQKYILSIADRARWSCLIDENAGAAAEANNRLCSKAEMEAIVDFVAGVDVKDR